MCKRNQIQYRQTWCVNGLKSCTLAISLVQHQSPRSRYTQRRFSLKRLSLANYHPKLPGASVFVVSNFSFLSLLLHLLSSKFSRLCLVSLLLRSALHVPFLTFLSSFLPSLLPPPLLLFPWSFIPSHDGTWTLEMTS